MSDKISSASIDPSAGIPGVFRASKEVVSRRNQDGTIILMKLDENSFFYKIDGIAAQVWAALSAAPRTMAGLLGHFASLYANHSTRLEADLTQLVSDLVKFGLIAEAESAAPIEADLADASRPYVFGGIKEFNLEQIETEVLNESIYLDVFAGSDLRLKTEMVPLQDALGKISRLEGVNYRWSPEHAPAGVSSRLQAGLIAQQVAEEMPELVRRDAGTGRLALEYSKISAYLVEALKELHQRVLAQDVEIEKLRQKLHS